MTDLETKLSDLRDRLWQARESSIGMSPYDEDLFDIIDELTALFIDHLELSHNTAPLDPQDTDSTG